MITYALSNKTYVHVILTNGKAYPSLAWTPYFSSSSAPLSARSSREQWLWWEGAVEEGAVEEGAVTLLGRRTVEGLSVGVATAIAYWQGIAIKTKCSIQQEIRNNGANNNILQNNCSLKNALPSLAEHR